MNKVQMLWVIIC